jgi:hypothetical protein
MVLNLMKKQIVRLLTNMTPKLLEENWKLVSCKLSKVKLTNSSGSDKANAKCIAMTEITGSDGDDLRGEPDDPTEQDINEIN